MRCATTTTTILSISLVLLQHTAAFGAINLGLCQGDMTPLHTNLRDDWAIWVDGKYPYPYVYMGPIWDNPWDFNGGWFEIDTAPEDETPKVEKFHLVLQGDAARDFDDVHPEDMVLLYEDGTVRSLGEKSDWPGVAAFGAGDGNNHVDQKIQFK